VSLYVQETWVNATERHGAGESDVYDTAFDEIGELYRQCVKMHGRCVGKVYIDRDDKVKAVGWVFQKRTQYEDSRDTFLLETWVTVHREPPTKTIEYHYEEVAA
jgi:hypothetical protein